MTGWGKPQLLGSVMPMQEHTKRMPKKMLAFFLAELKLQTRSVNHGRDARLLSCLRFAQDDAMAGALFFQQFSHIFGVCVAFEGAGFFPVRELEFDLVRKEHLVMRSEHLDVFFSQFTALC